MVKQVLQRTASIPDDAVEVIEGKDEYLTLAEVAALCGMHRVTLLRMEQNGRIPKAKWMRLPQPHRVYTKAEAMKIVAKVAAMQKKAERADEREYVG